MIAPTPIIVMSKSRKPGVGLVLTVVLLWFLASLIVQVYLVIQRECVRARAAQNSVAPVKLKPSNLSAGALRMPGWVQRRRGSSPTATAPSKAST